jgi:hypothetical protein
VTDDDDYDDYDDDDDYDGNMSESIGAIITKFNKKHRDFYISAHPMPSCCSGLVLSSGDIPVSRKPETEIKKEELVALITEILQSVGERYSWVISTLLMGRQGRWADVLKEAGFEESQQISKANSYNGSQPLKVFIKAMRPMTPDEVTKSMKEYQTKSETRKKGGYEW